MDPRKVRPTEGRTEISFSDQHHVMSFLSPLDLPPENVTQIPNTQNNGQSWPDNIDRFPSMKQQQRNHGGKFDMCGGVLASSIS